MKFLNGIVPASVKLYKNTCFTSCCTINYPGLIRSGLGRQGQQIRVDGSPKEDSRLSPQVALFDLDERDSLVGQDINCFGDNS